MNPSYNEREVLELLQDESTQKRGFELIVAQYSEQLYWQIRRMVLLHEDANDLLQNTFIKAWTNIDYFRGDAKLSTWLYRIALNECLTFLNKQRAVTTVSIDDEDASVLQKLESDPYFSGDRAQKSLQKAATRHTMTQWNGSHCQRTVFINHSGFFRLKLMEKNLIRHLPAKET
jgi:RNA polymerase sigma-70 factor, ECF subfamily